MLHILYPFWKKVCSLHSLYCLYNLKSTQSLIFCTVTQSCIFSMLCLHLHVIYSLVNIPYNVHIHLFSALNLFSVCKLHSLQFKSLVADFFFHSLHFLYILLLSSLHSLYILRLYSVCLYSLFILYIQCIPYNLYIFSVYILSLYSLELFLILCLAYWMLQLERVCHTSAVMLCPPPNQQLTMHPLSPHSPLLLLTPPPPLTAVKGKRWSEFIVRSKRRSRQAII